MKSFPSCCFLGSSEQPGGNPGAAPAPLNIWWELQGVGVDCWMAVLELVVYLVEGPEFGYLASSSWLDRALWGVGVAGGLVPRTSDGL